ncbi:MAG TPA: hypothetical protein VEQ59_16060, partial [Polyangiaceae bacterium]|nr:hypothetical protein [Polyangiaceae bacterium]
VCASPSELVERAVRFGLERASLEPLQARLREGREACVLFDTPLLVQSLEALYDSMWADYAAGRLPRPRLENLEGYLEVGCSLDPDSLDMQELADYDGFWLERLAARHRYRPLGADGRMVTDDLALR